MNKITQTARYRQSLILYAQTHGVTAAAKRYRTYRQYIYRWMKRYDGTLQSLEDHSQRPHSHAKQHRPEEIKLIDDMRRRNPNAGLLGVLGQAAATRLQQIDLRPVQVFKKKRTNGR